MKIILASLIFIAPMFAQADVFSPITQDQIPAGQMPNVSLPPVDNPNLFKGKSVAILASHGVEESEITFPYQYLAQRGAQVDVLVPSWTPNGIVASRFLMPTIFVKASGTFHGGLSKHYDLMVLTGGAWNAQVVRTDDDALALVKAHYQNGGPIAAICAGTAILINAGIASNLTMTGSPPVRQDLINAGAIFQDEPSVIDGRILTSRTPADLIYFVQGIQKLLANL